MQTRRIELALPVTRSISTMLPFKRTSLVATSKCVGTKLNRRFEHALDAAAEDAFMRARHAEIALKRRAAR